MCACAGERAVRTRTHARTHTHTHTHTHTRARTHARILSQPLRLLLLLLTVGNCLSGSASGHCAYFLLYIHAHFVLPLPGVPLSLSRFLCLSLSLSLCLSLSLSQTYTIVHKYIHTDILARARALSRAFEPHHKNCTCRRGPKVLAAKGDKGTYTYTYVYIHTYIHGCMHTLRRGGLPGRSARGQVR